MDEFRDRMKKLLEEALSEEYTVESREISDQNGKKRETLCVKKKGDSCGVRVYVDMLYEGYLRAEMNEKAMAEDIANYIQNGLSDKNDRSAED